MNKNVRVKGDRTPLFDINLQMFNSGDGAVDGNGLATQGQQVQQPQQTESQANSSVDYQQNNQQVVDNSGQGQEETPQFSTPQQNHAFAEMRVKNKKLEQQTKELEEKLGKMSGIIGNQFKDQGINDVDGYLNYYSEYEKKELENKARYGDTEAIQKLAAQTIVDDPRFKQMEQVSNAMLDMIARQKEVDEVKEFNGAYGQNLNGYKDITGLPNANQIIDLMQENNLSLTQAYTLANSNSLMNQQAKQAKQEVVNTNAGYGHVRDTVRPSNDNLAHVPQDIVAEYRKLFPGITHEEISKHYKG